MKAKSNEERESDPSKEQQPKRDREEQSLLELRQNTAPTADGRNDDDVDDDELMK